MCDATAANEHIGSMAALPPLERAVRNGSLSPAGKCMEAATAPICYHVVCNSGTVRADIDKTKIDNYVQFDRFEKKVELKT